MPPFAVGLTRDFLLPDGKLAYPDVGLDVLDAERSIRREFLGRDVRELGPEDIRGFDAIVSMAPRYTRETFEGADRLALIARFGVGYDMIDVAACTEAGVLLCITKGAVDHNLAQTIILFMLALSQRLPAKDRITREGNWDRRVDYMGSDVKGKTLGIVGLGGIGSKLVEMARPLGVARIVAFDPYLAADRAATLGVEQVPLDLLMKESDFVSVSCPLTEQTRGLIGAEQLAHMKPGAFLINTARGGIVDEAALVEALEKRRIAGAATDVFEKEPVGADHPLMTLDNVIVTPHSIAWTDEFFGDLGRMACSQVVELSRGRIPPGTVNPQVTESKAFKEKLGALRS